MSATCQNCGSSFHMHGCAMCELRAALLSCARKAEALKRECGMDQESPQAIRNAQYQAISTVAHIALGTIAGSAEPARDGWQLVPTEPTTAMQNDGAMQIAMNNQRVATAESHAVNVWRAMLAAAKESAS